MINLKANKSILGIFLFTAIFIISTVDARPRGGGGKSFSRGGVASGGSFSANSRQQIKRGSIQRQEKSKNVQTRNAQNQRKLQAQKNKNAGDLQKDRQDWKDKNREDRQDFIHDQGHHYNNHWDSHYGHYGHYNDAGIFVAGVIVGGAIVAASTPTVTVTYVTNLPCTVSPLWLDSNYFYQCGGVWYQRGFSGGNVRYLIVSAPPGQR